MKVIKVKNYEELSRTAATIIAGVILSKPDCILGLATGSSPVGTYDQLAAMYEEGILDFSHVKSVNLDEYVGLDGSNDSLLRKTLPSVPLRCLKSHIFHQEDSSSVFLCG